VRGKAKNDNNSESVLQPPTIAGLNSTPARSGTRERRLLPAPGLGQIDRLSSRPSLVVSRFRAFSRIFRHLVHPAALMPHARINRANRRPQAGTAGTVENQAESLAFQSAPIEIFQQRLPDPLDFRPGCAKSQQMPAAIAAGSLRHQHLRTCCRARRSPHRRRSLVQKEIDIVVTQPRLMKLAYRLIQIPRSASIPSGAVRSPVMVAIPERTCRVLMPRKKRFPDQQRNLFRPALKSPQPHRQKALAPGARNAQPNRPEPSHEISLVVAIAVIAPLPRRRSYRPAAGKPVALSFRLQLEKLLRTRRASAITDRPRNSAFISARKCWKCFRDRDYLRHWV